MQNQACLGTYCLQEDHKHARNVAAGPTMHWCLQTSSAHRHAQGRNSNCAAHDTTLKIPAPCVQMDALHCQRCYCQKDLPSGHVPPHCARVNVQRAVHVCHAGPIKRTACCSLHKKEPKHQSRKELAIPWRLESSSSTKHSACNLAHSHCQHSPATSKQTKWHVCQPKHDAV